MSDDVYLIGDQEFSAEKRDYVSLDTTEGKHIAVALTGSNIPFQGRLTDKWIGFTYDSDYKYEVDEIVKKATSEEYADFRRELRENFDGDKCLHFLPAVAKLMHMTEGTLRSRPLDIQYAVCRRYADLCICDYFTIKREIEKALLLRKD